jgi:hypothetical protein
MSVRRIRRLIYKAVLGVAFVLAMVIINGVSAERSNGTGTSSARAVVCVNSPSTVRLGCVGFYPTADSLSACDYSNDGRVVAGRIRWYAGGRLVETGLLDLNTSATGCGIQQFDGSLAEGAAVWVRVCIQNLGCSRWVRGAA